MKLAVFVTLFALVAVASAHIADISAEYNTQNKAGPFHTHSDGYGIVKINMTEAATVVLQVEPCSGGFDWYYNVNENPTSSNTSTQVLNWDDALSSHGRHVVRTAEVAAEIGDVIYVAAVNRMGDDASTFQVLSYNKNTENTLPFPIPGENGDIVVEAVAGSDSGSDMDSDMDSGSDSDDHSHHHITGASLETQHNHEESDDGASVMIRWTKTDNAHDEYNVFYHAGAAMAAGHIMGTWCGIQSMNSSTHDMHHMNAHFLRRLPSLAGKTLDHDDTMHGMVTQHFSMWMKDINMATITGLDFNKEYHFDVVVRRDGEYTSYHPAMLTTGADPDADESHDDDDDKDTLRYIFYGIAIAVGAMVLCALVFVCCKKNQTNTYDSSHVRLDEGAQGSTYA